MKKAGRWWLLALLLGTWLPLSAAEWTVMVRLAGDGPNEAECIADFLKMALVGSNADVNILVEFDRVPGYTAEHGNWIIAHRFRVLFGMNPTADNAVADWGDGLGGREIDTSSRTSLVSFLDWGMNTYPANRYALIVAGRGRDWEGLATDETSKDKSMTVKDLRRALHNAKRPVDLVALASDRASLADLAYEIRHEQTDAAVLVVAQDTLSDQGWPYAQIFTALKATPTIGPVALGTMMADECFAAYGADTPFAVIDLTAMEPLALALKALSKALVDNWQADPAAAQAAAADVLPALGNAVIHARAGAGWPGATGIGTYFPSTKRNSRYTTTLLGLVDETRWDRLLNTYFNDMRGSWVSGARLGSQEFGDPPFIDLGDLCARLAAPTDPRTYAETSGAKGFVTTGGVAQKWQGYQRTWTHPLPFTFTFYGVDYHQVHVASSGYLDFTDNGVPGEGSTAALMAATRIAALWDNLDTTDGDIYINQPDSRSIRFRWRGKRRVDNTWMNVSALLQDTGDIEFFYGSGNVGLVPTIGLSAGNGLDYDISAFHTATDKLAGAASLRFATPAPLIRQAVLADDLRSHVDVYFNRPVFANNDGTGALVPADLNLVFADNGGATADIAIAGLTDIVGDPLAGGEQVIRVLLDIVGGPPTGVETVSIGPADRACVFNADGYPAPDTSTTLAVNINGIPVTQGRIFPVAAAEIDAGLAQLTRKPTVKGEYFDPLKDPKRLKALRASVKVVSKVSVTVPLPAVDCEWTKKAPLFSKSAHTAAYAAGKDMATILAETPMYQISQALPTVTTENKIRYEVPGLGKALMLVAPQLTATTTQAGVSVAEARPEETVRLHGWHFGVKAPKVWLEYRNAAGAVKMKSCKILKPLLHADRLGNPGKSCMVVDTGESAIDILIPKLPTTWIHGAHNLVIDNGIGRATIAFATVAP